MGVRFTRVAVVERGKQVEALEFAATISEYVEEQFDTTVTWGLQIGGTVGAIHWYSDYGSLGELEEILGRTMTDAGYMKLIAEAQDLFRDAP